MIRVDQAVNRSRRDSERLSSGRTGSPGCVRSGYLIGPRQTREQLAVD